MYTLTIHAKKAVLSFGSRREEFPHEGRRALSTLHKIAEFKALCLLEGHDVEIVH